MINYNKKIGVSVRTLSNLYVELNNELSQAVDNLNEIFNRVQQINKSWYGGKVANNMYNQLKKYYENQVNYVRRLDEVVAKLKPYYIKAKQVNV